MTFGGRPLSVEDNLRWKTTFSGRQPSLDPCCVLRFAAFFPFKLNIAITMPKITILSFVFFKNILSLIAQKGSLIQIGYYRGSWESYFVNSKFLNFFEGVLRWGLGLGDISKIINGKPIYPGF